MGGVVPTGLRGLDEALGGGIRPGTLTLIYGDEKSGKTSLALGICASAIKTGLSAAFVDCGGRIHPQRVLQVLDSWGVEREKLGITIIDTFLQQEEVVIEILDRPPADVIVLDDITYQHRVSMIGDVRADMQIFKRLAFQVAALKESAATKGLVILMVGQVHALPGREEARPVAQRILTHWPDLVLRISRRLGERCSKAYLEKPSPAGPIPFKPSPRGVDSC